MNRFVETELRVLLVDDDEDDHLVIRDYLSDVKSSIRIKLDWISSYDKAREAIARREHDAYLVDYRLGEKTGLEFLREGFGRSLEAPFIMLTGQGDREVDEEAMRQGAADYLVKSELSGPLLERSIRYSINRVLAMRELRDRQAQIIQQDRLASIGLLASSLAHEIGTPLGVIRGRAELLQIQGGSDTPAAKSGEVIIAQIDRVSKLIRSLLTLARGDAKSETSPVAIGSVLDEVAELMAHEFRKKSIAFENRLPADLTVLAQSGPLHQVFLNLLVNAVHAIDSAIRGGRAAHHHIRVEAREVDGLVHVSVEDTGCGISESNLRELFKPFFTTKDIGVGTGLGLATSYRIVEGWGGKILVKSQEGVGTVFTLALKKA